MDKALAMDRTHNNNSMNMSTLHKNLPTLEELRFRQVVNVPLVSTQGIQQWNAVCVLIAQYVILKLIL